MNRSRDENFFLKIFNEGNYFGGFVRLPIFDTRRLPVHLRSFSVGKFDQQVFLLRLGPVRFTRQAKQTDNI